MQVQVRIRMRMNTYEERRIFESERKRDRMFSFIEEIEGRARLCPTKRTVNIPIENRPM